MYRQILKELSLDYEKKRDRKARELELRKREVYEKLPVVKEIDQAIFKTGVQMARSVLAKEGEAKDLINLSKERLNKLQRDKAIILTEANIPLNYLELDYDCEKCKDKGYLEDGRKCSCLGQKLVSRLYYMSNIEKSLERENFDSFDLERFSNEPYGDELRTPRENINDIRKMAENFVMNFDCDNQENLLFYGGTGLGKTFLSNCIARELIRKEKIVIYQTAFNILELVRKYRFDNDNKASNKYQYELLFDADLLIIDDLGTESKTGYSTSEIFNIVNSRILGNKKTLISTNLTTKEISNRYSERVYSRVLDKFTPLKFYGKDIRWQV